MRTTQEFMPPPAEIALLPCPSCGWAAHFTLERSVKCGSCGLQTAALIRLENAAELWNNLPRRGEEIGE